MQVRHKMDYEYEATTCIIAIGGWCPLIVFLILVNEFKRKIINLLKITPIKLSISLY